MLRPAILSIILTAFLLLQPVCHAAGADTDTYTAQAVKAAEDFLLLIDTGQYGQSWEQTASYFKKQVPMESWVKQISSVRPAFGNVASRTIIGTEFVTALPGAPDGQYVIIQYDTSFVSKRKAVETITPMLDQDGTWRIAGYYIK